MLYKVTPSLAPLAEKKPAQSGSDRGENSESSSVQARGPKVPRKRRKSAVYDAEGNEVLITMMCLKCRAMKPLTMFGLRKMADGAIRNQPWCRACRSGAGTEKGVKGAKGNKVAPEVSEVMDEHAELETTVDTGEAHAAAEPGPTPPSSRNSSGAGASEHESPSAAAPAEELIST